MQYAKKKREKNYEWGDLNVQVGNRAGHGAKQVATALFVLWMTEEMYIGAIRWSESMPKCEGILSNAQ